MAKKLVCKSAESINMRLTQKDSAESAPLMKDLKHAASATSCSFSAYLD